MLFDFKISLLFFHRSTPLLHAFIFLSLYELACTLPETTVGVYSPQRKDLGRESSEKLDNLQAREPYPLKL